MGKGEKEKRRVLCSAKYKTYIVWASDRFRSLEHTHVTNNPDFFGIFQNYKEIWPKNTSESFGTNSRLKQRT